MPTPSSPRQVRIQRIAFDRFRCIDCGTDWSVDRSAIRMPIGWWKCPQGCNANALVEGHPGS